MVCDAKCLHEFGKKNFIDQLEEEFEEETEELLEQICSSNVET